MKLVKTNNIEQAVCPVDGGRVLGGLGRQEKQSQHGVG